MIVLPALTPLSAAVSRGPAGHATLTASASRRVDGCGKIGLYHGKMYVGPVNRGKEVVVQFDAETAEWAISDAGGVELCRRKPDQFNEASLKRLPIE